MTREEAKSKASIRIQFFDAKGANKIIDQIFNDHEAQLEAKDELIKVLEYRVYHAERYIKAKDELIKVLECRAYHAEGYIKDLHSNSKEQQWPS